MLRDAFRASDRAPHRIQGQVKELLHHELYQDTDHYHARVVLSDGREVEALMRGSTFRPWTHFTGCACPYEGDWFESISGLPLFWVGETTGYEAPPSLGDILDEKLNGLWGSWMEFWGFDEWEKDPLAINPALDERNRDPAADRLHKCGESADLSAYNYQQTERRLSGLQKWLWKNLEEQKLNYGCDEIGDVTGLNWGKMSQDERSAWVQENHGPGKKLILKSGDGYHIVEPVAP